MENLILEWQKRQQKYEELADKYKEDAHNNRKFTYKAMATRDCWKELSLKLQQTDVSMRSEQLFTYCVVCGEKYQNPKNDSDTCYDCREPYCK